ncbi:PBSX family phage terminase large subunit [Virgibacillus halodenitrificans]|uniref:PBSX family phage terminase large subunit n=1 Tax=Virgibacillus halodenitrificans TaxID=1482 RepID=UPI000EF4ACD5|nr:PBSX family phage terminase large subunit [Virgibacillus halodenitrificans]
MSKKPAPFKFKPFSRKQLQVLTWWRKDSPVKDMDGIICDGSVRAGKTVVMSLSYVMWAMETFEDENLGMSGKTIGSFRRNVITPLKRMLKSRGYKVKDHRADNMLAITFKGKTNYFYVFGGKDEGSQDLIQGITLAGMFFDEVALMPESFVSQATARCSVAGAKFWFNCNPEGPYHWFKQNWLDKRKEKNLVHLHFTMEDNLSLEDGTKKRYYRMYSGIFYKRFILGLWVLAEGIIYDMFREEDHVIDEWPSDIHEYQVTIDYGTKNPTSFILQGIQFNVNGEPTYFNLKEYYYDGRKEGKQKTDNQYYEDLEAFCKGFTTKVIIDPSAASFITLIRSKGKLSVTEAENSVIDGIRTVSRFISEEKLFTHRDCTNIIRERFSYVWDEKAANRGEDKPVKDNDHAMDAERYGIYTNEKHNGRLDSASAELLRGVKIYG